YTTLFRFFADGNDEGFPSLTGFYQVSNPGKYIRPIPDRDKIDVYPDHRERYKAGRPERSCIAALRKNCPEASSLKGSYVHNILCARKPRFIVLGIDKCGIRNLFFRIGMLRQQIGKLL